MLFRLTEALLLLCMGSFMAFLSQSSFYWQFLNPRYSWLTLGTGLILALIGCTGLLNTRRTSRASECLAIAVFLTLALTALTTIDFSGMGFESGSGLTLEYQDDVETTVAFGGTEYVKINVAELFDGETQGYVAAGKSYAIQGTVVRSEELDRAGYIGVGRLLITCCFADSLGVVTLVKVGDPEKYAAGSWVRALGVLEPGTPLAGRPVLLTGALTAVRSGRFVLRAEQVAERPVEGVPFLFEVRNAVPFAY